MVIYMLKRKAYDKLTAWKAGSGKNALLVTGARQVGKTYLIREFAKDNYENFVEINLVENRQACDSFNAAKSSSDLFLRITVEAGSRLVPGKTLIFIDEVQEAKEIVTYIKFLIERGGYDYILSGSMLGVELNDIRSAPVGYMKVIELFPLDFEEFCWAKDLHTDIFDMMKKCFKDETPVEDYIHNRLLSLFHHYLIVGGMPEAVAIFVDTDNLQEVRSVQTDIIDLYRRDIARYSKLDDTVSIRRIFDLIPTELNQQNKRFIIKSIGGEAKFERNENRFLWIVDANVARAAYNVEEPRYPLLFSKKSNYFKLFLADVGLLTSLCGMNAVRDILNDRIAVNFGALYENVVAQELTAHGHKLFYFKNKSLGEVDFLLESASSDVTPVEVKSGKDYKRHRALNNIMDIASYDIRKAYVLHEGNLVSGSVICYIPIYMVSCL
jgi:predicted AAA+ superfamily ATPase